MQTTRYLIPILVTAFVAGGDTSNVEDNSRSQVPREWTVPGTQWRLHIRQYVTPIPPGFPEDQTKAPRLQDEFEMTVTVLAAVAVDEDQAIRFHFKPGECAPYIKAHEYILCISKGTGQAIKTVAAKGDRGAPLPEKIHDERLLLARTLWFPLDWITDIRDLGTTEHGDGESRDSCVLSLIQGKTTYNKTVQTSNPSSDNVHEVRIEVERQSQANPGDKFRVVQTWVPGEPWWRTFQRFEGDRLDLEAEFVEGSLKKPDP